MSLNGLDITVVSLRSLAAGDRAIETDLIQNRAPPRWSLRRASPHRKPNDLFAER